MHLLIPLVIAAGGVLTVSLPQNQPPISLQQYYKILPPAYAPRPVKDRKSMYTYAEVNTPYYQYHYYSPVFKNYHNQPPFLQASSPEPFVRNDVNSYAIGATATLKSLFYPATTNNPLSSPEYGFRNNAYTPRYESSIQPFSARFGNNQGVPITSKPLTVNSNYAPMFKQFQGPVLNKDPSPATPVSTPIELASGFPNILRERYGHGISSENLLPNQAIASKPDKIVPVIHNPNFGLKPVVPDSIAAPSSAIIKDEVRRRGISPQLPLRDQFDFSSNQLSLENSSLSSNMLSSTSSPPLNASLQKFIESSSSETVVKGIPETILRVYSSPYLDLIQNYTFNSSDISSTEIVFSATTNKDLSKPPKSTSQSTLTIATQIPTDTTLSHLQKIAKKVNPTVAPKKFLSKHPNVLFYSPGHDIPN